MNQDSKDRYLKLFSGKLENYYIQVREYNRKPEDLAKAIEAFMEAGIALEAVTKKELELVVEEVHKQVFGLTPQERSHAENQMCLESRDFTQFDLPAWERKKT